MSTAITHMTCNLPAAWDIGGWLGFMRHINAQETRNPGGSGRWHIANDNDASAVSDPHHQPTVFGAAQSFARRVRLARLQHFNISYIGGHSSGEGAAS